jgi:hypothetical protein
MHETEKLDSFAIDFAFQGFWCIGMAAIGGRGLPSHTHKTLPPFFDWK